LISNWKERRSPIKDSGLVAIVTTQNSISVALSGE